ncbi:MAG: metal-dependent hydrolase [Planctomycetota bacterium]|jgi:hypothetical protein
MIAFLFGADTLIERRPFAPRTFWALFDVPVHAILALLVVFPLVDTQAPTEKTAILIFAVLLIGTLLDVDHFVAAKSLKINDVLSLPIRPTTHSLAFSGAVGILVVLVSRNPILSWIVFAALVSHVLRDAGGGKTPILWPLPVTAIPLWTYYLGVILLLSISYLLSLPGWMA